MIDTSDRERVLLVSPHPDDEIVGAPGTTTGLQRAGHEVTNLALTFGRPGQERRRVRELATCLERAGFRHDQVTPPIAMTTGTDDDFADAQARVTQEVLARAADYDLIISPGIPEGHPAHETTALGVADALSQMDNPPRWWTWATSPRGWMHEIGAERCAPSMYVPYGERVMAHAVFCQDAHAGENARRDFRQIIRRRARRSAQWLGIVGYADLLNEMVFAPSPRPAAGIRPVYFDETCRPRQPVAIQAAAVA
jgi:LmbE family N-acetylglucosaminyl deacetylase